MASPREGGNSDCLLEAFIGGFEEAGGNHIRLDPARLKLAPCRGCQACGRDGLCVISDDMRLVEERIADADAMVIVSPVYFYGFPSQFKALIDRSQAAWARLSLREEVTKAVRPAWTVLVGETGGAKLFEGMLLTLKYFLQAHGFSLAGKNLIRTIDQGDKDYLGPDMLREVRKSGYIMGDGAVS